jgi:large conductance mechanosensitive channel
MSEQKKTGFVAEFKEFISRGSVVDLAVGVIIGGGFSKIVTSFVTDIISPIIGIFTGKANLSTLSVTIPGGAILTYGNFIQSAIDFILIALFIFLMIKAINVLRRKQKEEPPAAPPAPTKEEQLLTEIRDLLAKK